MKTPRELLFEKHSGAQPALDQIRRNVLANRLEASSRPRSSVFLHVHPWSVLVRILAKLWAELIVPSRKAWTGVAAAWIFILGFSLALSIDTPAKPAGQLASRPDMILALRHQQEEMAELVQPDTSETADAPSPAEPPRKKPQPRSSLQPAVLVG